MRSQRIAIELSTSLYAPPNVVFDTWLDPLKMHQITAAPAVIDARVGGAYALWGGSIRGEFVYLDRPRRIAQTWRTEDFGAHMDASRLELTFEGTVSGTRLVIVHGHIPISLRELFVAAWREHLIPRLQVGLTTPLG